METDDEFVWAVKSDGHLATRKAGGSARAQARELRDAEPVRTRLARLLKVHTDERAYRLGAKGEESVGNRLAKLPSEWPALHDIVRNEKGTNLDHLVIGPGGVYSLNAKHHPDKTIVVTGRRSASTATGPAIYRPRSPKRGRCSTSCRATSTSPCLCTR